LVYFHGGFENGAENGAEKPLESGGAGGRFTGMSTSIAQLTREVFALPRHQRLALADFILSTDDDTPETDAERAWAAEIRRRVEAVKNGTAKTVPYEEVMAEMANLPGR
jgi:putative addiction module component (TIGR02574 family)